MVHNDARRTTAALGKQYIWVHVRRVIVHTFALTGCNKQSSMTCNGQATRS